jgi:large subunit ribosomal protein L18
MAIKPFNRKLQRAKRHTRIRKYVAGTAARPRLSVYRSLTNIYVQLIDDEQRVTLASVSSLKQDIASSDGESRKMAQAKFVGKAIADVAQEKGIKTVVFDRGGFLYHGRIKALADAARAAGLEF